MEWIYLNAGLKLITGFLIVAVYIQLSGRSSLAPVSALDQVGNIVLGAIIGGPLYNPSISFLLQAAVASAWAGMLLLVRYLSFKRWSIKNVVDGKSIQLMKEGRIVTENFGKARISVRDFIMLLHQRGYPALNELSNVWFEYNGQMTVVKKGERAMAIMVIENGQLDAENMEVVNITEEELLKEVDKSGYKLEDIFIGEWHDNKLWIYPLAQGEKQ